MKYYIALLFLVVTAFTTKAQIMHCGYDFTSYIVLDVHEAGKTENIKNLKITIVNKEGKEVINLNNVYSFKHANEPLLFSLNYKIGDDNKRLAEGETSDKERWFFPFAEGNYLLSVANTFPADDFSVKVEDVDGEENGGKFKTVTISLYRYNMYVLCSNDSKQAAMKFGRKMNKPIDIIVEKE